MTIVEYKLDPQDKPRSYHPKTIPSYITDGGYWFNPDGSEKMIGVQAEGSTLPDTATVLTLEELKERMLAIHAEYPMKKNPQNDEEEMNDDEVNAIVKEWVDARS